MEELTFRSCGKCTACCDGHLIGNSYGNAFGNKKPCIFLVKKICAIYETRPQTCRNYQCAWTQGILPEWMKPSECGILVSVEIDKDRNKYLKIIEMKPVIDYEVYKEIDIFCKENSTYYVKVNYESRNS